MVQFVLRANCLEQLVSCRNSESGRLRKLFYGLEAIFLVQFGHSLEKFENLISSNNLEVNFVQDSSHIHGVKMHSGLCQREFCPCSWH